MLAAASLRGRAIAFHRSTARRLDGLAGRRTAAGAKPPLEVLFGNADPTFRKLNNSRGFTIGAKTLKRSPSYRCALSGKQGATPSVRVALLIREDDPAAKTG